jgi:acetyl-CoA carboxylase carboxyl transferase subunit alpha
MAEDHPKTHNEWERPLRELEDSLSKLKEVAKKELDVAKREELDRRITEIESRRDRYVQVLYRNLGPWEKVLVARAEKRPYTLTFRRSVRASSNSKGIVVAIPTTRSSAARR